MFGHPGFGLHVRSKSEFGRPGFDRLARSWLASDRLGFDCPVFLHPEIESYPRAIPSDHPAPGLQGDGDTRIVGYGDMVGHGGRVESGRV